MLLCWIFNVYFADIKEVI